MRTLSATLEAAQRAASGEPYVRVRLWDRDVGVMRLRWLRWYTGSEADGPCGVAMPADGALLRARINPSDGALWHQRVASPGAGSTYSAWVSLGTVAAGPRLGLAAAGTRALLATVRSGGAGVEVRESIDSGASLGASALLTTAGSTVTAITCTLQAAGSAVVFYAASAMVYAMTRVGTGAWSAPVAWSRSLASVTWIAARWDEDHEVLVSGTTSAGLAGAWASTFGAGNLVPSGVWMSLVEVAAASAGTSISYLATGIGRVDTPRALLVESYSGGGAYHRVQIATGLLLTGYADQLWRDPQPFDHASAHGVGFTAGGSHAWLASPAGVWHAAVVFVETELTADVLSVDVQQGRDHGRVRVTLRNDDARYAASGAPQALAPGGELLIDPGYRTAVGAEGSEGMQFWITAVRRVAGRGAAVVEIEAVDGWGLLEAWTVPRQLVWAAGGTTAAGVLGGVGRRAGILVTSNGGSAEGSIWLPAFTMRAGEHAATAFRRLLDALPDLAVMRGAVPTMWEPLVSEATVYTYGVTHPVTEARIEEGPPALGWARVFGQGVFAEAVDGAAMRSGAATAVVLDNRLAAQARVDVRAATTLRKAALAVDRGEVVVQPNVGQEVGDVIEVTVPAVGLVAARFRVAAVRLRFARGGARPVYEQTLTLSAV